MQKLIGVIFTSSLLSISAVSASPAEALNCIYRVPTNLSQPEKIALCSDSRDADATLECFHQAPTQFTRSDRVRLCSAHPELLNKTARQAN